MTVQAEHSASPGGEMVGGGTPHTAQTHHDGIVTRCRTFHLVYSQIQLAVPRDVGPNCPMRQRIHSSVASTASGPTVAENPVDGLGIAVALVVAALAIGDGQRRGAQLPVRDRVGCPGRYSSLLRTPRSRQSVMTTIIAPNPLHPSEVHDPSRLQSRKSR